MGIVIKKQKKQWNYTLNNCILTIDHFLTFWSKENKPRKYHIIAFVINYCNQELRFYGLAKSIYQFCFSCFFLLGTRISHREIPELEDEKEIRG